MEAFGFWEAMYASAVVLNIVQSAVAGTILWLVSQAYGRNCLDEISEYVGGGLMIVAGSCVVVIPLLLCFRNEFVQLLGVSDRYFQDAVLIYPILIAVILAGGTNEILSAVVSGTQNAGGAALVLAGATVTSNVVAVLLLMRGYGLRSMLIGTIAAQIFSFVTLTILARRAVPGLTLRPRRISRGLMAAASSYYGFLIFGSLSILLRDHIDKILLSNYGGGHATGYYAVSARLAGMITMLAGFIYIPALAAAGALFSAGKHDELGFLYRNVSSLLVIAVGSMAVLLGGYLEPVVVLWMGKYDIHILSYFYWMLAGNLMAVCLTGPGSAMAKGIGLKRPETIYIIVCITLNIALKLMLVPMYGASASVWSSAISWSVGAILFFFILRKASPVFRSNLTQTFVALLLIAIFIGISRFIATQCSPYNTRYEAFVTLVLGGAPTIAAFIAAMAAAGNAKAIGRIVGFVMTRLNTVKCI